MLYPAELVRATDSYWINRETAEKMVAWIKKNGFAQPADHLIDQNTADEKIPIFWLDPTLVNQGSHTGLFPSSIQNLTRGTFMDQLGWQVKIIRRKYLYPLIGIDLRKNG
jgi:glycosyl transferase family 25